MRILILGNLLWLVVPAMAAERSFVFSDLPLDQAPAGFQSVVTGRGKPGDWKIIPDAAAPATNGTPRPVLAQLSRDPANEHFPILVFDGETYSDFTLTTRFKMIEGVTAQLAGLVFRYQDEKNFYALYASAQENRFRFFKVANGFFGTQFGPKAALATNEWHEMTVRCEGNAIHCLLDGKELIPTITDNSFSSGKIGFWTKSDAVSYFADAKIDYHQREILARTLVQQSLKDYPRVLGLKMYARRPGETDAKIVASKNEADLGIPGTKVENDVIDQGTMYFTRGKGTVAVTLPLRDRNGDPIAAVWVEMKAFLGETQDAAVVRAKPIVVKMQAQVHSLEGLLK